MISSSREVRDTGKPLALARSLDVAGASANFDHGVDRADRVAPRTSRDHAHGLPADS